MKMRIDYGATAPDTVNALNRLGISFCLEPPE